MEKLPEKVGECHSPTYDICENCKLIGVPGALCCFHSAAPDLLAACGRVMQLQIQISSFGDEAFRGVHDAIAKAKGLPR